MLERVSLAILSPFQNFTAWTVEGVFSVWSDYVSLVNVRQENRRLKTVVDRLVFENTLLTERIKSYERLDKLLDFPDADKIPFEVARIIGKDTSSRVRLLIINKGSRHGLSVNMPVITYRGLVGRIVLVSGSASKVLMINDVRSAVDGIVQETRDSLVVVGANSPILEIKYLAAGSDTREGDRVVSSGLGGVYPKGLVIGVLTDIKKVGDSLFYSASLKPMQDLDNIEEVVVLLKRPAEPFPEKKQ